MTSQMHGKVAIVTGSSAGIGEAIALMLVSRGAHVTFCGRDKDRLQSVLKKAEDVIGEKKDEFLAVAGDLKDRKIREEIIEQTVQKFGRIDILVANAGIVGFTSSFMDDTEESYDNILDTNLKSVFFLIQKAVPHLEKTKGNIVTISSIVTSMALPFATVYSLSKAALDHLTRCLAVDLGSKGIRVNSVNPGYFPTLIMRDLGNVEKINSYFSKSEEIVQPLKGRIGVVQDVAEAVGFLVSEAAGFITGELIKVDGGRTHAGTMNVDFDKLKL